jgi:hypothetical protein
VLLVELLIKRRRAEDLRSRIHSRKTTAHTAVLRQVYPEITGTDFIARRIRLDDIQEKLTRVSR